MSEPLVASRTALDALLEDLEACDGLDGMRLVMRRLRDHFAVRHMAYLWLDATGLQSACDT